VSKKLIITAAAGLVSFTGAFAVAWLTNPAPVSEGDEAKQLAHRQQESILRPPGLQAGATGTSGSEKTKAMTEKELKNLVYEVREKIQGYNRKLADLETREERLQIAHNTIKEDIEELNNMRIELASIVAGLKSERDKLLKSRVEIAQAEKANLISIAATYDKMEPASAGKILTNMSKMGTGGVDSGGSSLDDVVKILHYMTERTKAKLLAELVTSEPMLSAVLCQRLKQIVEEK
jgi:flagellar motility protein MotE (MotC chaperone)